jgi:hypothetical protein
MLYKSLAVAEIQAERKSDRTGYTYEPEMVDRDGQRFWRIVRQDEDEEWVEFKNHPVEQYRIG